MDRRDSESIPSVLDSPSFAKASSLYRFAGDCYREQLQPTSEYLALMATQNPLMPVGQWVQYNVSTQSPRAMLPSAAEQTIGMVRQAFTAEGNTFYQVIWNPGGTNPIVGLYTQDQLCALDSQTASDIRSQLAQGTYQPSSGTPGESWQQPNIPVQAAPPSQQTTGEYTL